MTMSDGTISELHGVTIKARIETRTPKTYWDDRYTVFKKFGPGQSNEQRFNSMDYLNQEVIKDKVKDALEGMYDNIDIWLPTGFKGFEPGKKIVIELELSVVDHDTEISNRDRAMSFKMRNIRRELEETLRRDAEEEANEDETIDSES